MTEGDRGAALVITASDGAVAGMRHDTSGELVAGRLSDMGFAVDRALVPDDRAAIEGALRGGAEHHDVIVTTGGTGLTPRDVTPQATVVVIDYEVPGIAEAMRAAGRAITPLADLSRGTAGVLGRTLIVNLPGSPKAAIESFDAIAPLLHHAIETLAGPYDHGTAARVAPDPERQTETASDGGHAR